MIIGEAPGAEEDRLGEPFVGRSGKLLDQLMARGLADQWLKAVVRGELENALDALPEGKRLPSEVRARVLDRATLADVALADGDVLEIVHAPEGHSMARILRELDK